MAKLNSDQFEQLCTAVAADRFRDIASSLIEIVNYHAEMMGVSRFKPGGSEYKRIVERVVALIREPAPVEQPAPVEPVEQAAPVEQSVGLSLATDRVIAEAIESSRRLEAEFRRLPSVELIDEHTKMVGEAMDLLMQQAVDIDDIKSRLLNLEVSRGAPKEQKSKRLRIALLGFDQRTIERVSKQLPVYEFHTSPAPVDLERTSFIVTQRQYDRKTVDAIHKAGHRIGMCDDRADDVITRVQQMMSGSGENGNGGKGSRRSV